jgi:type IV secretory pathway VirB3-like protein
LPVLFLPRAEGAQEGRQALVVEAVVEAAEAAEAAVGMVVEAAAAVVVVDMVVVVVAADTWVEVARAQGWAVAARRTARAARLWRLMATHWRTTAPTRAPCMPPTQWPANIPRPNTTMRPPWLSAQIIITIRIAASPNMAELFGGMVSMVRFAIGCRTRSIPGTTVTVPLRN